MTTLRIWKFFSREDLYECYQCARCTGSCPAMEVAPAIGPRETILRCLNLGHQQVVEDERLWLCCTCHVCEDRCPQKIPITDLLVALRNSAARRGNIPDRLSMAIELLAKTGRSMIVHQLDEMRAHHGLAPLGPAPVEEIRDILEKTKLDEVVEF
ncbi:MAG: 4Fe-4S dicluster domain-containing protein [Deltaproteobacteria bacterium]|jgi:heterodisulfide reductase subunit C